MGMRNKELRRLRRKAMQLERKLTRTRQTFMAKYTTAPIHGAIRRWQAYVAELEMVLESEPVNGNA